MKRAWAVLVAGMLAVPVWAQNVDDGDAPDQGVARLSLMSEDVTVQRGDTGEVVAGELNAPLVALDHVLTGPGSRAEVQFDWANMIRLGPVSEVRLGELRDGDYLIQVAEGTTTFRVLRDTNARVEISTPTVSVRPTEKGVYRITVRPDGATEITVRSGQAEIFTPRGTEILRSGRTMQARGTPSDPEFMISSAISKDDWDRWNEDRDRDLDRSRSYQYVSRDIYGADDLDGYGRWVYDSPYGWVWVPNVASTWAPYRIGRWSWVNYYGWTWVSGDPWGWAPYHYGRWYSSPYGWAWYPGATIGYRYYWRPALVGFFGWGNTSISIGIGNTWGWGNIGWVPLAPYEIYRPWYGPRFRNTTIINNYTIVNNTNIVNVYRNARQMNGRNGVTSIQAGNFGRGRVNNDNYVRVSNNDLTRAGQVQGGIPFEGTRDSRRFSDRTPEPATATRATSNRDRQFATAASIDRSRRAAAPAPVAAGGGGAPSNRGDRGTTAIDRGASPRNDNPRNDSPRAATPAPATSGGWRRFDPGSAVVTPDNRGDARRGADVRSIDNPRGSGSNSGGVDNSRSRRQATEISPDARTSAPSADRGARRQMPEFAAPAPRNNTPEFNGNNGSRRGDSQPVQINPPIVRDRGGDARSAPRVEAPVSRPAPQPRSMPTPSAPRMDDGGRRGNGGGGGGGPVAIPSPRGDGGGGRERGAAPMPQGNPGGGGGGDRGRRR